MGRILHYCDKCGKYWIMDMGREPEYYKCEICKGGMHIIPEEYRAYDKETGIYADVFIDKAKEAEFIEKYVKTSPNFDQYYFDHKKEIFDKIRSRQRSYIGAGGVTSRSKVTCPYCNSTNTKKIGMLSRSLSTGIFGLASKKIGKQFHCNECGADF